MTFWPQVFKLSPGIQSLVVKGARNLSSCPNLSHNQTLVSQWSTQNHSINSEAGRAFSSWVWVKTRYPKWIPDKWKHGLKPKRSLGGVILTHTQLGPSLTFIYPGFDARAASCATLHVTFKRDQSSGGFHLTWTRGYTLSGLSQSLRIRGTPPPGKLWLCFWLPIQHGWLSLFKTNPQRGIPTPKKTHTHTHP